MVTPRQIPWNSRDDRQRIVLDALHEGASIKAACERAGITTPTFYNWRHGDSVFAIEEACIRTARADARKQKHARSGELLRFAGEKMVEGLLVRAAGGADKKLTPEAAADLADNEDARAGLDVARKLMVDGIRLDRVSHDLPANGPEAGTTVNVAASAQAGALAGATGGAAGPGGGMAGQGGGDGGAVPIPPAPLPARTDVLARLRRVRAVLAPPGGGSAAGGASNGSVTAAKSVATTSPVPVSVSVPPSSLTPPPETPA